MMRGALVAAVLLAAACHKSTPAAPAAVAPAAAPAHDDGVALQVVVNGKPTAAWTSDTIARTAAVAMTNHNGQAREGWPLKALTRALIGDQARVVALAAGDERVAIDERAWNDPSRTLVLRLSRRGEYKAHWVQAGRADEAFLKNVSRIEVVR